MARAHLTPVNSEMIKEIGYDSRTQALTVVFRSGGQYAYTGVPVEVHSKLMSAESHGRFFLDNIRNNPVYGTALVAAPR